MLCFKLVLYFRQLVNLFHKNLYKQLGFECFNISLTNLVLSMLSIFIAY